MPNFKFIPDPSGKKYKVDIYIYQQGDKREDSHLNYVSTITLKQQKYDGFYVNIRRENVVLDSAWTHDNPSDTLVFLKSLVLKNLNLFISGDGIIHRVRNLKNIQKSWKEIRLQVESSYKGDGLTELLNSIEDKLSDTNTALELVLEDPFISLFLRLFNNRKDSLNTVYMADFPLPDKPCYKIYRHFCRREMDRSGFYKYRLLLTVDYSNWEDIYSGFSKMKQEKGCLGIYLNSHYFFADRKTMVSFHGLYEAKWKDELWKKTKIDVLVL